MTLKSFFASVLTKENLDTMPSLNQRHMGEPLTDIPITPEMVEKKLKKLKPTKSAGPDGLQHRVLLESAQSICIPLSMIFKKSLKPGHITPLHKKGPKILPGNYRHVCLTSVVCKVMESLIRDKLVKHMTEGSFFCDAQHGFIPGRSYMTQLLVNLELWTAWLDKG